MPKIDVSKQPVQPNVFYPAPFRHIVEGREKRRLGDVAGLTQFGVNLTLLKPGAASAIRHWHESEDEFVYVLKGEVTLVENEGDIVLKAGEAAGFKAGVANAHHLVNRSLSDVVVLEIGTRAQVERTHYPDDDLQVYRDATTSIIARKSGETYA